MHSLLLRSGRTLLAGVRTYLYHRLGLRLRGGGPRFGRPYDTLPGGGGVRFHSFLQSTWIRLGRKSTGQQPVEYPHLGGDGGGRINDRLGIAELGSEAPGHGAGDLRRRLPGEWEIHCQETEEGETVNDGEGNLNRLGFGLYPSTGRALAWTRLPMSPSARRLFPSAAFCCFIPPPPPPPPESFREAPFTHTILWRESLQKIGQEGIPEEEEEEDHRRKERYSRI